MSMYFQLFSDINFSDPFFESLKHDYSEFSDWLSRKAAQGHSAYVFYNASGVIDGFLYLKREDEAVDDVYPSLPASPRLKVGTFKINPHGTRLGERFIKKIFDHAIEMSLPEIYVTAFAKHEALINLLMRYGFGVCGEKNTHNGTELVLIKRMALTSPDPLINYPMINLRPGRCFLLPIHPEYHTRLLPDSILNNENMSMIQDVSHTNSIHKVYLTAMHGARNLQRGDLLMVYRTGDGVAPARFRAVVTSIGVVEEIKNIQEFSSYEGFYRYCASYSVFSDDELARFYRSGKYPYIIKFSYNVAMRKRITRGDLLDNFGFPDGVRWGIDSVNTDAMRHIMMRGGVDESIIVN